MELSAETSKADQVRALVPLVGAIIHFDCPSPGFQPSGLFQCVGWALKARADDTVEFKVNGVAVDQVHWHDRPDAARDYPEMHTSGFTFWIDANEHVGPESKALILTTHVNGAAVGTRYLRVLREDDARTKTLFYFLHIPKTAGTAVLSRLRDATANLKLLEVYENDGAFTPDQLRVLSPRSLQAFDLLYGHFDYGMHVGFENPYKYLTILRDPFDFVVSQYFFQKYVLREPRADQRSILDFLRNNPGHLDNSFCRILCGDIPFDQPVTRADYSRALTNMDQDFAFVGMRERLPESMAQISGLLGVDLVADLRGENITPATPERANLDMRALRAAAEDRLQYDLMLYEEVGRRYFGLGPKRRAEVAARNAHPTPHHNNGELVESAPRSSEPVMFAAIETPLEALSGPGYRAQDTRGATVQGDEASITTP